MSDRLASHLGGARDAGRKLLVPYLTFGYPDRATTEAALVGLAKAGADAIELGVPFSDPLADGPVIQAASERALAGGATLAGAIEAGALCSGEDRPPLVLFTYANPLAARGWSRASEECAAAGFGGILVADLPFDEDRSLEEDLAGRDLALVRLAAPTTPADRLRELGRGARGFVYLIARTGVTGSGRGADQRLAEQVAVLREVTTIPIVVGFGIESPDDARRVADVADGVVVGTAFIRRLGEEGIDAALGWMAEIRAALDEGQDGA